MIAYSPGTFRPKRQQVTLRIAPLVTVGLFFAFSNPAKSATPSPSPPGLAPGYIVDEDTISPDHRFGITAYDDNNNPIPDGDADPNKLIEISTGRVLASIKNSRYMMRQNHDDIMPTRWSKDENLALWAVFGKWTPDSMVLLILKDGSVQSQLDVLKITQQAILRETKKASPKKYMKVKGGSYGDAYPDGFAVDVDVIDPIAFPLHVRAVLTSNPKGDEGMTNLDSHLDGTLNKDGVLKVTSFDLGSEEPPHKTW